MSNESGPIVELRRYALRPGARDTLIELFDRELVEAQEALGMQILGQFRDLDDPDSFVWLRGFSDMESRKRGLEAFYRGPVWKEHGAAANATMVDSDNVLLLRPISALALDARTRPGPGSTADQRGLIVVTIYPLAEAGAHDFPEFFAREVGPVLGAADISVPAFYATEHSRNTFSALPVREDEDVFVWLTVYADEAEHARHVVALERAPLWRDRTSQALAERIAGRAETLRLRPTARSLLHG
jgi:heme-degrading monooxygenase HmoA